eukprot:gene9451-biopygen4708
MCVNPCGGAPVRGSVPHPRGGPRTTRRTRPRTSGAHPVPSSEWAYARLRDWTLGAHFQGYDEEARCNNGIAPSPGIFNPKISFESEGSAPHQAPP